MNVGRILIVEDNFILNYEACEILKESGHEVKPVYCGLAAFEAIDRREYLTALLTDIDLGPGPDGVDVARYGRALYPHLPVVFMSATTNARYAAAGVARSELVAKPFQPRQIVEALARVIRLEAA